MFKLFKELYDYRELTQYLVVLNLKTRYRGSILGFLWTLLNPLLLMLVMWVVFSRVARVEEDNYALFLLSGLIVWLFFSQSIEAGLNSIIKQRSLMQKIYVPKVVFPVAVVTSNLVNLLFALVAYIIVALLSTGGLPSTIFLLVPALLMLYLVALGSALLLATLNVFFRDFTHLTSAVLRALFYLTPVIYPPDLFGEQAAMYLKLNPVYYPVITARDVLYYGKIPTADVWLIGFASSLLILVIGATVFMKNQKKFVFYA
ncbi:MAG: ABC transporter permease [Deltaproteobacteria bacterium]|jgi:ABC-type polysaccharide/polyol phosphate export permease|nr:ABC transporter permease [Deltaproteobacteria bacterium]MBT6435814.1 ABC transporter permease [Deltaproteobacteria bacterium]MBT6492116.1 ABC transporter permease [Deltaproteobacteria bacterium]